MQLVAHLVVGGRRETDAAWLANALEPRRDVDAVAHQVAVGLLDHVAEMDPDPQYDASFSGNAFVAIGEAALHLDRAARRLDHAAKLRDHAVAGALDDAPAVRRNRRVHEIAP